MWCIDSCYAECAGQGYDATLSGDTCRWASGFGDQCMREFIQCACFLAGDVAVNVPQISRRLPVHAKLLLNFFECACEALTVIQKGCEGAGGQALAYAVMSVHDCALSIASSLMPPDFGAIGQFGLLFEMQEQLILEGFAPPNPGEKQPRCFRGESDIPICIHYAHKVSTGECQPIQDYFR